MGNERDVNQDISGNHNTQINSGNDTIAAIGSGAYAAGRDIIINSNDDGSIKLLKRQIELLEEALANSKQETDKETKRVFALEASIQAEKLQKEARDFAEKNYKWEKIVDELSQILSKQS